MSESRDTSEFRIHLSISADAGGKVQLEKSRFMDWEVLDDVQLMERLKRGQTQAFDMLVRKHQQPLFNFFRRMGVSFFESEDLVQDVFLRLFSYRKEYQPLARFTTFLYTLARHVWIDHGRKNERKPKYDSEKMEESISATEDILAKEIQIDLQEALKRLPEKLRMVIVMSIYQSLKYQEIAEILDIPLGTVKSRMYLALKQLQEILNATEARPGRK